MKTTLKTSGEDAAGEGGEVLGKFLKNKKNLSTGGSCNPKKVATSLVGTKNTLETSGKDVKTTLETNVKDVKTTLETSGEDAKIDHEILLSDSDSHDSSSDSSEFTLVSSVNSTDSTPTRVYKLQKQLEREKEEGERGVLLMKRAIFDRLINWKQTTLETSGEDVRNTLETSGEDVEIYTLNEWRMYEITLGASVFLYRVRFYKPPTDQGLIPTVRCKALKNSEVLKKWETTLETSGEDVKLHSKRVEKMLNYPPNEWRRC